MLSTLKTGAESVGKGTAALIERGTKSTLTTVRTVEAVSMGPKSYTYAAPTRFKLPYGRDFVTSKAVNCALLFLDVMLAKDVLYALYVLF